MPTAPFASPPSIAGAGSRCCEFAAKPGAVDDGKFERGRRSDAGTFVPAEIIDRTPGGMPNGPLRPLDGGNTLPDERSTAIVDEAAIAGSPTGMPPES